MILFINASKTIQSTKKDGGVENAPTVVLDSCTAVIPTFVRASVEHDSVEVKAAFLQLIFGSVKPDRGRVVAHRARVSPVLNLGANPGLLIPTLTVRENINFQARLAHIKAKQLIEFVCSCCDCADDLDAPLSKLLFPIRRAIEVGIFAAVDCDCVLVDHFELIPDYAQALLLEVTKARGAGLLFTTTNPNVAKRFRQSTIVVGDGTVSFSLPEVESTNERSKTQP